MGNSITKKYDVPKEFTATAGHSQLWKIWPAKSKETGKDVSIWVFDKSELSKRKVNNTQTTIDKAVVEQIYQIMKKDLSILREISSSSGGIGNIVQFVEIIEDSPSIIAFATERVLCSLADLHSSFEGIVPSSKLDEIKKEYFSNVEGYKSSSTTLPTYGLSDIEVSRGILNISEGLQYLHTVQRKLHLNLTPESIVITPSGLWKLCGMGFSLGFQQGERQQLPSPYFLQNLPNGHIIRLEPDLRYCGPELTTGGFNPPSIRYLTSSADVFSLGLIAYESYRFNLDSSASMADRRTTVIPMSSNSAIYHQTALENLTRINYNFLLSTQLIQLVMDMTQLTPTARIAIPNIVNHPYFSSGPLQVLKVIDSLKTRDIGTQSSQLLILPSQLPSLPDRLLEGTVLPAICQATQANAILMPHAIPTHSYIAQRISKSKYCSVAGPSVIQAMENNTSIEVMRAMLKNIVFFADLFSETGTSTIESSLVTLLANCLDKPDSNVHIPGFRALCDEKIRLLISHSNLINKIVPRVCREACKNSDPNVKIHALYVLSLIAPKLDKTYIIQNILPSLKYITDNERNPLVSMCVLGNYNVVSGLLGPDYIAKIIVPSIAPLLVDRSLDKKQFELVGHLLRVMLSKVYEMRSVELGLVGDSSKNMFYREGTGADSIDPFYAAKVMIQETRIDTKDEAGAIPPTTLDVPSLSRVSPAAMTSSAPSSGSGLTAPANPSTVRVKQDAVSEKPVDSPPRSGLKKVGKKSSETKTTIPSPPSQPPPPEPPRGLYSYPSNPNPNPIPSSASTTQGSTMTLNQLSTSIGSKSTAPMQGSDWPPFQGVNPTSISQNGYGSASAPIYSNSFTTNTFPTGNFTMQSQSGGGIYSSPSPMGNPLIYPSLSNQSQIRSTNQSVNPTTKQPNSDPFDFLN